MILDDTTVLDDTRITIRSATFSNVAHFGDGKEFYVHFTTWDPRAASVLKTALERWIRNYTETAQSKPPEESCDSGENK